MRPPTPERLVSPWLRTQPPARSSWQRAGGAGPGSCDTVSIAASKTLRFNVAPPDLPAFGAALSELDAPDGELAFDGELVELEAPYAVHTGRVQISESDVRGLTLRAGSVPGIRLADVALSNCDLSNVDGREGSLVRVEIRTCRLVGFALGGGMVRDVRVVDSALLLSSFAFTGLRNVIFERVNLREASFMNARLQGVEFRDCQLEGADFRGVKLSSCAIRGSTLDGILGVDSLKGLAMPWSEVLSSAAALATAVGIAIEE